MITCTTKDFTKLVLNYFYDCSLYCRHFTRDYRQSICEITGTIKTQKLTKYDIRLSLVTKAFFPDNIKRKLKAFNYLVDVTDGVA